MTAQQETIKAYGKFPKDIKILRQRTGLKAFGGFEGILIRELQGSYFEDLRRFHHHKPLTRLGRIYQKK